uniref:ThiF family adenylyltransferase n=1 Tax=Staphylococcus saprophyticus TaxID=29385 RepID=UPI001CD95845
MNERYSGQIGYEDFGEEGEERLEKVDVMIMGGGGLGSDSGEMLGGMGVGE